MPSRLEKHGRCLCGAVELTISLEERCVSACHCHICRTWGGGPLMVVHSDTPPRFTDDTSVKVYGTSDWAERGFCATCGSHLFYRLKNGSFYAVPVGLLLDDDWTFDLQVFIEEKPAFYCFSNQTKTMTGEEVFAQAASD